MASSQWATRGCISDRTQLGMWRSFRQHLGIPAREHSFCLTTERTKRSPLHLGRSQRTSTSIPPTTTILCAATPPHLRTADSMLLTTPTWLRTDISCLVLEPPTSSTVV